VVDDCSTDGSVKVAEDTVSPSEYRGEQRPRHSKGLGIARAQAPSSRGSRDDTVAQPPEVVCGLLDRFRAAVAFPGYASSGPGRHLRPFDDRPASIFRESAADSAGHERGHSKDRPPTRGGFSEAIRYAPTSISGCNVLAVPFVSTSHHGQLAGMIAVSAAPHNQWLSVYRARLAMIHRLRADGEADVVRGLEALLLECWEDDLSESLRKRRLGDLRFYASLSPLLPHKTRATRRLCRLAALPRSLMDAGADRRQYGGFSWAS
jgi:hypothetical protein